MEPYNPSHDVTYVTCSYLIYLFAGAAPKRVIIIRLEIIRHKQSRALCGVWKYFARRIRSADANGNLRATDD